MRKIKEFVQSELCKGILDISLREALFKKLNTILFSSIPAGTSSQIKGLLTGLLKRNPKDRMDFGKYTYWASSETQGNFLQEYFSLSLADQSTQSIILTS